MLIPMSLLFWNLRLHLFIISNLLLKLIHHLFQIFIYFLKFFVEMFDWVLWRYWSGLTFQNWTWILEKRPNCKKEKRKKKGLIISFQIDPFSSASLLESKLKYTHTHTNTNTWFWKVPLKLRPLLSTCKGWKMLLSYQPCELFGWEGIWESMRIERDWWQNCGELFAFSNFCGYQLLMSSLEVPLVWFFMVWVWSASLLRRWWT